MTWTYVGPDASPKDQVRFWVQDTDETFQLISDEEIMFLLSRAEGQPEPELLTAARAAERLAARFAREVDVSADGVSVSVGQLKDRFDQIALSLREEWKTLTVSSPNVDEDYAGFSYDSFDGDDVGVPSLYFGMGMHDNHTAGRQDAQAGRLDQLEWHP